MITDKNKLIDYERALRVLLEEIDKTRYYKSEAFQNVKKLQLELENKIYKNTINESCGG